MRIDRTGNVGIGTDTPIAPLHVLGNAVIETGSPDLYLATTSASHANWRIAAQEVVSQGFEIASGTTSAGSNAVNDTYTTRFVIKSSGNVGIGTTAPGAILHINKTNATATNTGFDGAELLLTGKGWDTNLGGYDHGWKISTPTVGYSSGTGSSNSRLSFTQLAADGGSGSANPSYIERVRIDDTGNLEVRSGAALKVYRDTNAASAQLFMDAGEKLYIRNSYANKDLVFDRDGKLGIGTASPSYPLHIQTNDGTTNSTVGNILITNLSTGTTVPGFGGHIQFQAERNNGVNQNIGKIAFQSEVNAGTNISAGLRLYTSSAGTMTEKGRISWDGMWFVNGVRNYYQKLTMTNNVSYTFDVPIEATGTGHTVYYECMYNHYGNDTYGARRMGFFSFRSLNNPTSTDHVVHNGGNSTYAGAWSVSIVGSGTSTPMMRFTKSAGSYSGTGQGYIHVRGGLPV